MCDTLLKKLFSIVLFSGVLFLSSCKKEYADGMDRATYTLSLNSSGSQQIPVSNAQSTLSGSYNAGLMFLNIKSHGLDSPQRQPLCFFMGLSGKINQMRWICIHWV